MSSLLEKQAPIDAEIADALVVATPESWQQAAMSVARVEEGKYEKLNISISSPEGRKEIITPTEEIYAGLYKLSDLFREYRTMWSAVHYYVELKEDGDWKYSVRFEY